MAVDVDPAREDQQAARIDRAAAFDLGNDPALGDADVLDDAIEPVGRIMDLPAGLDLNAIAERQRASAGIFNENSVRRRTT